MDAFRTTLRFAQAAEELGYHRLWLAEHHGSPALAGSAPEVLAAYLLARTSRIRVGTGGVLLQHYSPFKVAEVFRVLSALAPGRVDLGIGKAPGGLPATTRALQARLGGEPTAIDDLVRDLEGFLAGALPAGHPHAEAVANPQVPAGPERFLLGASPDSAALAAELGWNFTYAGHFDGDPRHIERSFEVYRKATGRSPSLALYAFASASAVKAREAVAHVRIFRLHLPDGRRLNVGSQEQAEAFARQAGVESYRIEEAPPSLLAGTPEQVRAELDELSRRYGVEEFVIDTPVADPEARIASIELIAGRRLTIAA